MCKGECLNDPVLTLFVLWECVPEVEGECLNDPVLTLFILWEYVPEVEIGSLLLPFLTVFASVSEVMDEFSITIL